MDNIQVFRDLVSQLNNNQIKDYYTEIFGKIDNDQYLLENDYESMRECISDPYELANLEIEQLESEIKKVVKKLEREQK
jgi:hypothetical protein